MNNKKGKNTRIEEAATEPDLTQLVDVLKTAFQAALQARDESAEETDCDAEDEEFAPAILENTGVYFRNIGGMKEIKNRLGPVVKLLSDPAAYRRRGVRQQRGILFKSAPGGGKMMLAKAVAQEAGVPFIKVSGADFDPRYVDYGLKVLDKLIETARETVAERKAEGCRNAACIIYISNLEMIAEKHSGPGSDHPVVMRRLAALMDSDAFEGITVIAGTNNPDSLDPSLLRPGVFDMVFDIGPPDLKARREILETLVRDRRVPVKKEVNFHVLAARSYGYSPAELEKIVNEAALSSACKGTARKVGMQDFREAFDRVLVSQRTRLLLADKKRIAIHEAGHAIIGLLKEADGGDKFQGGTIMPHEGAGGVTIFGDDLEPVCATFKQYMAGMATDFGGRAAEDLAFGGGENISSAAAGDIENATETARRLVAEYGFNSSLGLLFYGKGDEGETDGRLYSPQVSESIHQEMKKLSQRAYDEAKALLKENYPVLIRLAQEFMKHETLDRQQVLEITGIEPGAPPQPSFSQMAKNVLPPGDSGSPAPG